MMISFGSKPVLRTFQADLHIHSCLSPCGDWEMGPMNIIEKSLEMDLDIIAICDHNSSENAGAVMAAGKGKGITVLPGFEVCTREEVHVLAVFEELTQAAAMQAYVYDHLPGKNTHAIFGHQVIADCKNNVTGENQRLLIGATDLRIHEVVHTIQGLGGLCFAAHIDKQAFSIIKQLGFVPENIPFDGVELSPFANPVSDRNSYPGTEGVAVITSSDAHFLADIGKVRTVFTIFKPNISEIRMALKAEQGRTVEV